MHIIFEKLISRNAYGNSFEGLSGRELDNGDWFFVRWESRISKRLEDCNVQSQIQSDDIIRYADPSLASPADRKCAIHKEQDAIRFGELAGAFIRTSKRQTETVARLQISFDKGSYWSGNSLWETPAYCSASRTVRAESSKMGGCKKTSTLYRPKNKGVLWRWARSPWFTPLRLLVWYGNRSKNSEEISIG